MADAELRRLERLALSTGDHVALCQWLTYARRADVDVPRMYSLYCDFEGALEFIQECIQSRAQRQYDRIYHPDFYPVRVLQVYYAYHEVDEWSPHGGGEPILEGERFGLIADAELETGEIVPIWAEDWWAVPDAPDATTQGNKIFRLDDERRVMPYRWTLRDFAEKAFPFGQARLEEILEPFPDV